MSNLVTDVKDYGNTRLPVTVDGGVLANLPGNLVGHGLAHLPWLIPAGLSGDLVGHLSGNLVALLPGDGGALLTWDGTALLPWDGVALLLGDGGALGVGNGPGGINALGLWDLGAYWTLDNTGVGDGLLVADTPDLSLTPWGNADGQGFSLSLTLAEMSKSPHSSQSVGTAEGSSTSNTTDGSADNSTANNIALNSNNSSLGTVLGLDVVALFDDGSLGDWVRFGDTLLAGGGGALLVGHLPDEVLADLLGPGVADLLGDSVALLFRYGVADLFGPGVADVVVLSFVLGLADGVAHPVGDGGALLGVAHIVDGPAGRGDPDSRCHPDSGCHPHSWGVPGNGRGTKVEPGVAPGSSGMATVSTVSSPAVSIVSAVVSRGISLWLTQSQGCNEGEENQKLIHFVCRT